MNKTGAIFQKIEEYILYVVIGIFAVFVLSELTSPSVLPKEILLVAGASLVILLWIVRSIIKGSISFAIGKFDLGVILVGLVTLISALLKTPNRAEAFFYPGVATFTSVSVIFYFLVNQLNKKAKESALIAIFTSGLLLSLSILFTQLGVFAKVPQLPAFIRDPGFNPLGGLLPSVIYLTTLLPIGVLMALKGKDIAKKLFFAVSSAVVIFGIVIGVANLMPGKAQSPTFPSLDTSWQVAIETLKVSPIWGVGAGDYLTAFNLYRPLSYNQTSLWQVRFTTAGNYYFTLATELGLAGVAAFVILLVGVYKVFIADIKQKSWEGISVVLLLVAFLILPSTSALMFLLFVLLAIISKSENKVLDVSTQKVPTIITTLPFLIGIIAVAFFGTKEVMAEVTFNKSLDALVNNDAKTTYNLMLAATNANPQVDRYHASLAQVDMALATSLASKQNLTDADRTTITQLVQAAINEGKATVTLNPSRSGNWEILGQIYRSIMPFAQGANQFATQTYTEAVALDPTNPNLRISLGGVYYALGDYDNAIDSFKLAVLAKPDLANAHYNLAIAYREKKDYTDAITEINNVLTLVQTGTPDYNLAQTTLADLQKNIPAPAKVTSTGQSLTTPTPATTTLKPPITLPSEATPPAATP
jgi:tetratricopeptide (TPR) repeat protein